MVSDFYIRNVANVVHSWMNYLYEVSETEQLAAESSLRYPIAGLLERKKDVTLNMEEDHPCFNDARIDFTWNDGKETVFLEMKFVKNEEISVQEFYDDLFRLATIPETHCHKYFLVCGREDSFKAQFERRMINIKSLISSKIKKQNKRIHIVQNGSKREFAFDNILSFSIDGKTDYSEKRDCIFSAKKKYYKYYQVFRKTYKNKCRDGYEIPKRIHIQTTLLQHINMGFKSSVAVWEIKSL